MPDFTLSVAAALPADAEAATLLGRVWRPDLGRPSVVTLRDGQIVDVTRSFPTSRDLCENADPAAALRAAQGEAIGSLAGFSPTRLWTAATRSAPGSSRHSTCRR